MREMTFAETNDYGYSETEDAKADISKGEALARHLKPRLSDPFSPGDVIKFKVRNYSYAALKANNGLFYCTGTGSMIPSRGLGFAEFLKVLDSDQVSDIKWTDQWRDVK
jgi:hypothetical protein